MSWVASGWAKEVKTGGPAPKAVLLCLADYADADHVCFPGQETIARQTEQSVRTVRRHIEALEALGILTRERRFDSQGHRTSDRYLLAVHDPRVAMLDASSLPDNLTTGRSDRRSPETPEAVPTGQMEPSLPDTGDRVITSRTTSKQTNHQQSPAAAKRKPETTLPEDFAVSDSMKAWFEGQEWKGNITHPGAETQAFIEHARANDRRQRDWPAAWRQWMVHAGTKYASAPGGGRALTNRHVTPDSPDHAQRIADMSGQNRGEIQ